jgi:hypothetical protein
LPTWTRTVQLIDEHAALADAIGGTPSEWACYRFISKLRQHSDAIRARGFQPETVAADKGYDNNRVFEEIRERGSVAIVSLRKGRAIPLSPIPYGSVEWKRLYRGRAAVEREFGRLKNEYGLTPLRARGLDRVFLHASLVMLARLGQALSRARAVAIAA